MAYLKPYYHIYEVANILAQYESSITVDDVKQLGILDKLKIGLYINGDEDTYQFLVPSMAADECYLFEETIYCRATYKGFVRVLFDQDKELLGKAEDLKLKRELSVKISRFLKNYYYSIKKNSGGYSMAIPCYKNSEGYVSTIGRYEMNKELPGPTFGFMATRPMLIYPAFERLSYQSHWLTNPFCVEQGIEGLECFEIDGVDGKVVCLECLGDALRNVFEYKYNRGLVRDLLANNQLYVSREELIRFEQINGYAEHGLQLDTPESKDSIPPYLDESNPDLYAPELHIAIRAYEAVVLQGWGNKSRTIPHNIKDWLAENHPSPSSLFYERIATVTNPKSNKK